MVNVYFRGGPMVAESAIPDISVSTPRIWVRVVVRQYSNIAVIIGTVKFGPTLRAVSYYELCDRQLVSPLGLSRLMRLGVHCSTAGCTSGFNSST
jgi:hypothetical protein